MITMATITTSATAYTSNVHPNIYIDGNYFAYNSKVSIFFTIEV